MILTQKINWKRLLNSSIAKRRLLSGGLHRYALAFFFTCSLYFTAAALRAQVPGYIITADTTDTNITVKKRGNAPVTTVAPPDTTPHQKPPKIPRKRTPKTPWKAALMSGCVPGLGQFYNGRWWKAPIVWGAIGTVTYFVVTNHISYAGYRDAYRELVNNNVVLPGYESYQFNPSGLKFQRDYYQRTRDLLIIVDAVLWTLNVVDATVDAHLSTFDVSEDLSLNLRPAAIYLPETGQSYAGLSLSFRFGRK